MGTIVVVGSSNTDMVVMTPRLPGPGETVTRGTFFRDVLPRTRAQGIPPRGWRVSGVHSRS
jgi:hypothetical protein